MEQNIDFVEIRLEENNMNMTSEQRDLLKVIMDKKEILEELLDDVSSQKQTKNLQMEESISVAGITWSKFAEDREGNSYMLADENIGVMRFGKNNDWRESPIRKKLNDELYQKLIHDLGEDALVTIQTDLFSHDGLNDYGKCEDMVSLLTYDLYRYNRKHIKSMNQWWWLATPDSTPSGCGADCVRYVGSDGDVNCLWHDGAGAVRPFFILKAERSDA